MSSSLTCGPPPMPGIAEQPGGELPREEPLVEESTADCERTGEVLREVR